MTCVRRKCRCMTGRDGSWWWVLSGWGSGGVSAIDHCYVYVNDLLTCG